MDIGNVMSPTGWWSPVLKPLADTFKPLGHWGVNPQAASIQYHLKLAVQPIKSIQQGAENIPHRFASRPCSRHNKKYFSLSTFRLCDPRIKRSETLLFYTKNLGPFFHKREASLATPNKLKGNYILGVMLTTCCLNLSSGGCNLIFAAATRGRSSPPVTYFSKHVYYWHNQSRETLHAFCLSKRQCEDCVLSKRS